MGKHEEISEATRGDVLDDWIVSRNVGRTAEKFGLETEEVRKLIHNAAVLSRLPETVRIDIHGEVRRLQMLMDRATGQTQWRATRRQLSCGASSASTCAC